MEIPIERQLRRMRAIFPAILGLLLSEFSASAHQTAPTTAAPIASSTFDTGPDSWTVSSNGGPALASLLWNPQGYISGTFVPPDGYTAPRVSLDAPQKFLTALKQAYGGTLSFRIRTEGATSVSVTIGGMGFNDLPLSTTGPNGSETAWASVAVPLWSNTGFPADWLELSSGNLGHVSASSFLAVLMNPMSLSISASSLTYGRTVRLDLTDVEIIAVPENMLVVELGAYLRNISFSYDVHPSTSTDFQVLSSFPCAFTVASSANWLSITHAGGTTPGVVTVIANPAGLSPGTYNGTLTVAGAGTVNSETVPVTFLVASLPTISTSTNRLSFAFQTGGLSPPAQSLSISATPPMAFSVAAAGGSWLSVQPFSGTAPASLTVSVSPAGMAVGSYNGTITITAPAATNSPQSISVGLTVTSAATIGISSSLLNFAYQSGGSLPQAQTVTVSATSATMFTAAASGGSWLAVSPASGTTPASLSVSVNPAGLSPATYNGTITVTGTNGAQGTSMVNVALTVTATLPPLPTITGVTNAASYATGAVSPGELVTLFGTYIGPAAAASATTDPATGKLATTIGGVQVLFNGTAAPMIYASSTQVSAVVPYEMAGVASPGVWIKYAGQASNAYQLTTTTTVPGLFTQNASGSGPGAILNQDNSLNGPGNRAAKGSIVQVFLTGEGQTSPPSVTGAITNANLPAPQVTPGPLLAVGVTINGQPALYVYAGEAPGLVAGMMQLNVQIPANAASGDLPIVVSIGGKSSQNGVTVSVQ